MPAFCIELRGCPPPPNKAKESSFIVGIVCIASSLRFCVLLKDTSAGGL